MLKIVVLAASALSCASAFQIPLSGSIASARTNRVIGLRMTAAAEPAAAAEVGKRAEHFSAAIAHPQPVHQPMLML